MNFSLKDNKTSLNKEFILSRISEEQLFAYYISPEVTKKKLFRSKLRSDKQPTCSLYRAKNGSLIYKDFATGQHLNIFAYIMELFRCDYYQALRIIANDFGIQRDESLVKNKGKVISKEIKVEEKEFSKIQIEAQDFTELELKWWGKYGITLETLKKYNVFSCKHVFLNGQLIAKSQQNCPIFGYYGGTIKEDGEKHELWKCYFPKRKEGRFIGNYPSKKMQGYNQLPKFGNICVITKSLKDAMLLSELEIPSCAPNSETVIPNEAIINDLKKRFKYVIALWDNDYTGITFLNKFKKKYSELIYTWIPRKYGEKDITDFYKKFGKQETINLIKNFIKTVLR